MLLSLAGNLGEGFRSTVGLVRSGWLEAQVRAGGLPCAMVAGNGLGDAGVLLNLIRLVKNQSVDVIHAHEFYMNALGAAVSRLTGVPLVMTVHGKSYYPEKARRIAIYRMAGKRAAAVVAVSNDLRRFFSQTVALPVDRVQVIYNGIELRPDIERRDRTERCKELGIPAGSSIVGTVGNLYPVKGHIHLIRAARTILDQRPETRVVILGRGDQRETLLREAVDLGIQDRIHLPGYRDDTAKWLEIMDVFVLPSLSEGLPLSLLEAMAAGIPSVGTKVGGIPEVIDDGVTGLLAASGDSRSLAGKISSLLADPVYARELGDAGRRHIEREFSLGRMIEQYGNLYHTVL
jgi:glycosyltransferase involved in cell wall biosynthesis